MSAHFTYSACWRRWLILPITLFIVMWGCLSALPEAYAAPHAETGKTLTGYRIYGILPHNEPVWFGNHTNYNDSHWISWCVEMGKPAQEAKAVSVTSLSQVKDLGAPADLKATLPQLAWILHHKESVKTHESYAAINYVLRSNLEVSPAENIQAMHRILPQILPGVAQLARQYVAEAREHAETHYMAGKVEKTTEATGFIRDIQVRNEGGAPVANVPVTITLSGPAVFTDSGKNVWTGKTGTSPISLAWNATGSGTVAYTANYSITHRPTITRYDTTNKDQVMVSYSNTTTKDSLEHLVAGDSWEVHTKFQPIATSNVGAFRLLNGAEAGDTLTVSVDPNIGDGQWITVGGKPVPVIFTGKLYHSGDVLPAVGERSVSHVAEVATASLTFTSPGSQKVRVALPEEAAPGFYTWVWSMSKDTQTQTVSSANSTVKVADVIAGDWSDSFGIADEISVKPYSMKITTRIGTVAKDGETFLVDDVEVSGLPDDYGQFSGNEHFTADHGVITQELYFFHEDLAVADENIDQAELIARHDFPISNGRHEKLGVPAFKTLGPKAYGTYVFVTTFPGDGRVAPLRTSVTDPAEQFAVVGPDPAMKTTVRDADSGTKETFTHGTTTLIDTVCYSGLRIGKTYEVKGVLVDQADGSVLKQGAEPISSTLNFTADSEDGCVEMPFTFEASIITGKSTVVFEEIWNEGTVILTHTDVNDKDQTIPTPADPTLATTATDSEDGDHQVFANHSVTIQDKVCYTGLRPGKAYTLTGTLMVREDKAVLQDNGKDVSATTTVIPTSTQGCTTLDFTFDARALKGKHVVAFERLTFESAVIASHEDFNDKAQTVSVVERPKQPHTSLARTGSVGLILPTACFLGALGVAGLWSRRRV